MCSRSMDEQKTRSTLKYVFLVLFNIFFFYFVIKIRESIQNKFLVGPNGIILLRQRSERKKNILHGTFTIYYFLSKEKTIIKPKK